MALPPDAIQLDQAQSSGSSSGLPADAVALDQSQPTDTTAQPQQSTHTWDELPGMIGQSMQKGLQSAYTEVPAQLLHGASTYAGGLPEFFAKKAGVGNQIFPEPQTLEGKATRFGGDAYGLAKGIAVKGGKLLLGAAKTAIPALSGKGLVQAGTRTGVIGAGTGAIQTDPNNPDLVQGAERGQMATLGGGLGVTPAAISMFSKPIVGAVTNTGRWVAKNIGGVSDPTVRIIKELGADRVFDPDKSNIDYIGRVLVPKVKDRVVNALTNVNDTGSPNILRSLGIKPDDIEELRKIDPKTMTNLKSVFGGDWNEVQKGIKGIELKAKTEFDNILGNHPESQLINAKNTHSELSKLLKDNNWMNVTTSENVPGWGNVAILNPVGKEVAGSGIQNKTKTNLIKIFNYLDKNPNSDISVKQYYGMLHDLEATLSNSEENRALNRFVYKTQASLRDDATNSIPGLKEANKMWKDARSLSELEHVFNKVDDSLKLENNVLSLKNVSRFQNHLKYRDMLGKNLHEDLLAHLANQDFELVSDLPGVGGAVSPSRSGLAKSAITGATKEYYKSMRPKVVSTADFFKKKADPLVDYFKKQTQ